jgi:hypothetical protein
MVIARVIVSWAILLALAAPAASEPMQVPGSRVVLDLPAGFIPGHGGLTNERLGAQIRVFPKSSDRFEDWERVLQISAKAYQRGTLPRSDPTSITSTIGQDHRLPTSISCCAARRQRSKFSSR